MGDEISLELWKKRDVFLTRRAAKPHHLPRPREIPSGVDKNSGKQVEANELVEFSLSLEIIKMSTFESYADSQHCR